MTPLESALEWVKKFGHTETGWAARVLAEELELRPKAVGFNFGHASRGGIGGEPLSSLMTVDPGQVIDVRMEFDSYFLDIKAATVVQCHKGTAEVRVDNLTGDPSPVITVTGVTLADSNGNPIQRPWGELAQHRSVEDAAITNSEKPLLSSDPPDHPGYWYVICGEFVPSVVRVCVVGGKLMAHCPKIGVQPVLYCHRSLTAPKWLEVRRCCHAWADYFGVTIIDPDGWRKSDGVTMETPITAQDFAQRYAVSSCEHRRTDRSDELTELLK